MCLTRLVCVPPGDVRKKWNKRYFVLVQTPAPLLLYYRHFQGVRCRTRVCAASILQRPSRQPEDSCDVR